MEHFSRFVEVGHDRMWGSLDELNLHIDKGWVTINTYIRGQQDAGQSAVYVLAWPKEKGEPVYPSTEEIKVAEKKRSDELFTDIERRRSSRDSTPD